MEFNDPPLDSTFLVPHSLRLLASYRRWLGHDLIAPLPDSVATARALFHASQVVVSARADLDQTLNYGNAAALRLWESDWASFTCTPSRETAEPLHREAREELLARVRANGFIDDYSGVRISRNGRRFRIEAAVVWNVIDEAGNYLGQAAAFERWTPTQGTFVTDPQKLFPLERNV